MSHLASLSQLQSPAWASIDGVLVPYPDVRIHVSAEALTRALSVFEGIKGYWDTTGTQFRIRTPHAHYERLLRSARLLALPVDFDYPEFLRRLGDLAEELVVPGADLWFRATLHGVEGHWGEATGTSLVLTAFTQPSVAPSPMTLTVSSWRRGTDLDLPSRIKTAANYVPGRMARIEAHRRGADDALLLNRDGRVAEATGACVVMATDQGLVSPPPEEGALDSLTVRALGEICARDGIPFVSRPIERSELLVAREVGVAGTITELAPVSDLDGTHFPVDGLLATLGEVYLGVMRGEDDVDGVEMVPLVTRGKGSFSDGTDAEPAEDTYFRVVGDETGSLPRLDAVDGTDGPRAPTGAIPRQPQLHVLTRRS